MMMSFKVFGECLIMRLVTKDITKTLLPDPVVPATKRWGSFLRSTILGSPVTLFPKAIGSLISGDQKSGDSKRSFIKMGWRVLFDVSIPTTSRPGMGAMIRNDSAESAKDKSSLSF